MKKRTFIKHFLLHTALFHAQGHHVAQILLGHQDVGRDDGLADFGDVDDRRQLGGVVDLNHLALGGFDLVNHGGCRGD
ncbi:MAG: hypothetical protein PHX36_10665, partial [Mesotoga sp.]